jgi:hypothetical protein
MADSGMKWSCTAPDVMMLYHPLFWRTLRLVPLAGFFSSIHIMTVVAALKLNQVKMYCHRVSLLSSRVMWKNQDLPVHGCSSSSPQAGDQ